MAEEPSELHVHSEEAGDQGRRHKHQRYKGEHLHYLVLVEVDDTENSILQVLKPFKAEIRMIDQ